MSNTLDQKIAGTAQAMKQAQGRLYDDPRVAPPSAVGSVREPTVRDVLNQRLQQARATINTTEMLLDEMPESFLKLPMSVFHGLF